MTRLRIAAILAVCVTIGAGATFLYDGPSLGSTYHSVPVNPERRAQLHALPVRTSALVGGGGASSRTKEERADEVDERNAGRVAGDVTDLRTHTLQTSAALNVMKGVMPVDRVEQTPSRIYLGTPPVVLKPDAAGGLTMMRIGSGDAAPAGFDNMSAGGEGAGTPLRVGAHRSERVSLKRIELKGTSRAGSSPVTLTITPPAMSGDTPRGTKEGPDALREESHSVQEDSSSATEEGMPVLLAVTGSVLVPAPRDATHITPDEKSFSIAVQSTGTICLKVPYDLPGKLAVTDTSVIFSHLPVGAPKPIVSPSKRFDSKGHAEWNAWIPYDATGGPIGYIVTATGIPSGRTESWRIKCSTVPASMATAAERSSGPATSAPTARAMTTATSSPSLRELAVERANGEIWEKSRIDPTKQPTEKISAAADTRDQIISPAVAPVATRNPGMRIDEGGHAAAGAHASAGVSASSQPIDCRASLASPSPSDTSPAAVAWRASIAETSANCAVAERWRKAINDGPQPQWIKATYDEVLRNGDYIVRGWLADVQGIGTPSQPWFSAKDQNVVGDPNLSPLMWMCANNIPSPLWPEQYKVEADRPAIAGTTHYQLTEVIIEYNDHRDSRAVTLPAHNSDCEVMDDGHERCTFRFVAGCEPMWYGPIVTEWHANLPGRVEPGPRTQP